MALAPFGSPGQYTLSLSTPKKGPSRKTRGAAFGDLNGDGYPDLIASHKVFLNDAQGGFIDTSANDFGAYPGYKTWDFSKNCPFGDREMHQFSVGDFDDDGDLDVLINYGTGHPDGAGKCGRLVRGIPGSSAILSRPVSPRPLF